MRTPLLLVCLLTIAQTTCGYLVGPPLSLEKLTEEADLIFKGEAIGSEAVGDEWFKPVSGYAARETRFKVISLIKGIAGAGGSEVRFRHYDEARDGRGIQMYTPQFYHFEPGRTYIVFAHKTASGARQLQPNHTSKMDLGALRCRDRTPVAAGAMSKIYWTELMALRDSPVPADVLYAIEQLASMSEAPEDHGSSDFPRLEVLASIRSLLSRGEPEIAQAAIRLIGAGSPYLSDALASSWLDTVGVTRPGWGMLDPGTRNAGGALCWRELSAVANSQASPETRDLAIRALALVKAGELRQIMDPWLKAPEIPVRAAAMLLYADFAVPHEYTTKKFGEFAADPSPEVRKCVAYAIGFMQNPEIVPVLAKLRKDENATVRRAAMESLQSFRPETPAVTAALKADLGNPESQPLSLLALARNDPVPYLEPLARVIEEKTNPTNASGGEIPAFTAWKLVFKHLRAQPAADIRAGKWNRYLDALEKVGQYSSSEPRDIYAFYLQRGMLERAAAYRAKAKKAVTYDLDYYFKMVDQNPSGYLTE